MRKALVFSIVLHLAVVVLAYFGVPMAHKEFVAGSEPVAVELVTVAETTNLPPPRPVTQPAKPVPAARVDPKPELLPSPRAAGKPQPPAPPKPETPKAEPPVQAEAPVPEAKPKQVPEAKPKQVPEAKPKQVPEAKPKQVLEAKPQLAAKAEAQPPPAPVPHPPLAEPKAADEPKLAVPKPAQRQKPAPDQPPPATVAQKQAGATAPAEQTTPEKPAATADFQSVLKTVDTLARNEPQKPQAQPAAPKKVEAEPAAPQPEARTAGAPPMEQAFQSLIEQALAADAETASASASASGRMHDPSQSMTVSEIDEVRRQIERCWNVPAGARDGGDHVVTIRVEMSPDATPRSAIVLNETSTRGNAFHRAAAESALRAVLNPRCHPFKLPVEKYERWKTMTLVFDPKDMLGT